MKKWHLESIIIHDKRKRLSLPDPKRSPLQNAVFQNNDKGVSGLSCKGIGLISCFGQKVLGYIKKGPRTNS